MARIFSNPWLQDDHGLLDVLRWKFGVKDPPSQAPDNPAQVIPLVVEPQVPAGEWRISWLGHSSFLLQGAGRNILIDPVFSEFCAPFPIRALRRRTQLPCQPEDLPRIDAVLLTHSHYDHLDLPGIRHYAKSARFVVAEGHRRWLEGKGFADVTEVAWNDSVELFPGLCVTATPAQHFTSRTFFDRNRAHWCGWLIDDGRLKLWHLGDSGYCPAFLEIGEKYGPIDFAMIPIGAYAPRWFMESMHMDPGQAVQAMEDARCRRAVAMHWGTFRLTDEPMGEPPLLLAAELARRGIPAERFVAGRVGESWQLG